MTTGATYSNSRIGTGPFLFISGQTPSDGSGFIPKGIKEQTRLVLVKIGNSLAENDLQWDSVVKLTYYLRDINDLGDVRKAILDTVSEPRPAATLVEVSAFVDPNFGVEIDAVADFSAHR